MTPLSVGLNFGSGAEPRTIGRLGRDHAARVVVLEWSEQFASAPLPILPLSSRPYSGLLRPDRSRRATLPGLIEDSLPDGWGKLLLDLEIEKRGISRSKIGDLERLAFVGMHGTGAMTYCPEERTEPQDVIDLVWFEDIVPIVADGASAEDLSRLRVISGGSQGARPKFMAQLGVDRKTLRDHRMPLESGWRHVLIKGRASLDPFGSVHAEAAYGMMMRNAGIDVSTMFVLAGKNEDYFCTERFDRPGCSRLHTSTIAGLLDCGLAHGVVDYRDFIKLARILCRNAAVIEEVFRRMVFNARAFNRDDHVRNHAFLMDANGNWSLAPAYDVSFSAGPGGEHSMSIAGEGRFPGGEAFAQIARNAGIRKARFTAIIDQVDTALSAWEEVAKDHDVPNQLRAEITREINTARRWN